MRKTSSISGHGRHNTQTAARLKYKTCEKMLGAPIITPDADISKIFVSFSV